MRKALKPTRFCCNISPSTTRPIPAGAGRGGKYAGEHSGRDLTEEQFRAWSSIASQARSDYVEGKISGNEMLARVRVN